MAKLFGQIDEDDLNDLPDNLQNVIKAASKAQDDQLATINTKLAEMEAKLNPAETEEQKAARLKAEEDAKKSVNGSYTSDQIMQFENRKDVLLMKLERDPDKHVSTAVRLFRSEVEDNLSKSNPALRADEKYIRNLIKLSIGTHLGEIIADIQKNDGQYNEFFTENGASGRINNNTQKVDPVKNLTNEERKAAEAIGISYEDYAKSLAEVREGIF